MTNKRLRDERGAQRWSSPSSCRCSSSLVLGIAEFGHAFQVSGTLSAAAREGVRVMALQNDPAAARAAVRNAAPALDPVVTDAQITITPASCPTTGTGTTTVRLTVNYPMPFLTTSSAAASRPHRNRESMRCNG